MTHHLMIEKGVQWSPDSPLEVREQMRARGETPVLPPSQTRRLIPIIHNLVRHGPVRQSNPPGGAKASGNASQQAAHQAPTAPKSGGSPKGCLRLLQGESELDLVLDGEFVSASQRTYALSHSGDIVRVHPQSINGQTAASPTGSGLASWKP